MSDFTKNVNSNFFNGYLVIEGNYFQRIFREMKATPMIFSVTLFQNDLIIFEFFEYHLECRIEIAIIWDISELSILFIGKIIAKKEVLVSQDFRDGTFISKLCETIPRMIFPDYNFKTQNYIKKSYYHYMYLGSDMRWFTYYFI